MKAEIIEAANRAEITKLFLQNGWMVYKPEADCGGVDFLVMNLETEEVRKIQLKSRWTADKKYQNKKVWICFPEGSDWYLCEHDMMAEYGVGLGWKLWEQENGVPRPNYSTNGMSNEMRQLMAKHRFPMTIKVAA